MPNKTQIKRITTEMLVMKQISRTNTSILIFNFDIIKN
jgi:hypothetical protein